MAGHGGSSDLGLRCTNRRGCAYETVRPPDCLGKPARAAGFVREAGKLLLVRLHVPCALREDAFAVAHGYVPEAGLAQELCNPVPGRPCACYRNAHRALFLAQKPEGIDEACKDDYCRAVLVVVENRDVNDLFNPPLYF